MPVTVGWMTASAGVGSTGIAIVSVLSIGFGYALLWALWHFIFSPRNEHDDARDRSRRARKGSHRDG
jgi:hypothetical protein